ncbi:MAG: hypothetical protein DME99_03655 [Verrucomicrobia bacterium]|nr:MAG: hypothetical protein DME99_03655 [Verrucomicrobiota bacterium]
MTDAEFEKLDAKARRFLQRGRNIPFKLSGRLVECRDCGRAHPEYYMLKRNLWLQAVPTGRGCLCLECLAKRLGRPLVAEDFGDPPCDWLTGQPVKLAKRFG